MGSSTAADLASTSANWFARQSTVETRLRSDRRLWVHCSMEVCAGIQTNALRSGATCPSSTSLIAFQILALAILGDVSACKPLLAALTSPRQSVKILGTVTTSRRNKVPKSQRQRMKHTKEAAWH